MQLTIEVKDSRERRAIQPSSETTMTNEIIDVDAVYGELQAMRARVQYDPELGLPSLFETLTGLHEWRGRLAELCIEVERELVTLRTDPAWRSRPVRRAMPTNSDPEMKDREDDVARRRTDLWALKKVIEEHAKYLRDVCEDVKSAMHAIPRHLRDASYCSIADCEKCAAGNRAVSALRDRLDQSVALSDA